jgi:hypothetical protein
MVGPHRRTEAVANIENAGQLDVRSQGEKKNGVNRVIRQVWPHLEYATTPAG